MICPGYMTDRLCFLIETYEDGFERAAIWLVKPENVTCLIDEMIKCQYFELQPKYLMSETAVRAAASNLARFVQSERQQFLDVPGVRPVHYLQVLAFVHPAMRSVVSQVSNNLFENLSLCPA